MNLQGKIAVVTGAGRGIGRAVAARLASAGATVVINFQKNAEAATSAVREIESRQGKALAVQGDVATVAGIQQFFQSLDAELIKRFGSPQFDVLVNNAGVGRTGTVESTTEQAYDELMNLNVKGAFFVTQAAVSRLRDNGRIINISSALSRYPRPSMIAYSMGKAALNHFSLILASDLGKRGITANTLAPGLTVTEFTAAFRENAEMVKAIAAHTALGRLGEPDDIAAVAAFLASDDSHWITGQYIEASGGIGLAE